MGNICGCVRSPKEEYYIDPSKAPLRPGPSESGGRRYFQRKKRKSGAIQPTDSTGRRAEENQLDDNQGIYVGKVPVLVSRLVWTPPQQANISRNSDRDSEVKVGRWPLSEDRLHGVSKLSKCPCSKESLLEKQLLRKQVKRAASFGIVEDTLCTLGRVEKCTQFSRAIWKSSSNELLPNGNLRRIVGTVPRTQIEKDGSRGKPSSHLLDATVKHKSQQDGKISDVHVSGESEDMTAKERLLLWSQQMTEGYVGVRCDNFTTSWRDGRLFNALIHKYRPDLVDMSKVSSQSSRTNLEQAFCVAEQLGVARLLDPEDVDVHSPDEKSVITYVSTLYDVFPKVPEGTEGINANDVDIKWVEYQNMVNYLGQWIKHHITVMSSRAFPNTPAELKALYAQYLQFKETEIPLKENEKTKIKHFYKMLEMWIEFGRIQLPQGYHPNDVEKEWGKLIIAMLEREKTLRPEVDRLEMLQQIANKVQQGFMAGENKLVLARSALQSDTKRLESGIQFQNESEIAGYLLDCENLLRQQVVDIQILLEGKFYLADQLVQRVSKLRDDLFILRNECSSIYSQGRTLTTEQTKMMISGITQSLNPGFSSNGGLPLLSPTSMVSSGPTFTSSLVSGYTPSLPPVLTPGVQTVCISGYGGGGGGMEHSARQKLSHIEIRKPMGKSSLLDPNLSEEEVNMKFVQDLLSWVEEMQVLLDNSEWGSDLPSVEMHLENHKDFHRAIEEFQMSLKEAKLNEMQMTHPLKISYSDKLSKLESLNGKLLNTSRIRQRHLESLHGFVSLATQELIWLNEKEEEEVAYDWSDNNINISKKRDYNADLMRELEEKMTLIKSVQDKAETLLLENHPARSTIEAYKAAIQTQWNWILQLCGSVEQHLKENALYFEFFADARESMDYLKNLQDTIQRKYGCDRTSTLHRLEDLVQESMEEKEQLLNYRRTVASLVSRAKGIVQLKPRSPESPVRTSIPIKAICDYRQIEITIYKDDECVLVNNSHRAKWKVISPSGNEAMVPSVCFTIPPPNKDAVEMSTKIEQLYQNVLALWHHSHINMKSVVSWHYLMNDIQAIRKCNIASVKTMLLGEHKEVLNNLQSHLQDFLEDSEESEVFTMADRTQVERDVVSCKEYYEELINSAEREEHEESHYGILMSELRNFRMRLEGHEEQLIRQVRTPLDRDDLQKTMLRITEQERTKKEMDRLKDDFQVIKDKCEMFFSQASASSLVPNLSSELSVLSQDMSQLYSMSSIYLDKLKTVSLVLKLSQDAESVVKLYEAKLCEEDTVNADTKTTEALISTLKQWRTEIDEKREVFHDLEDELQKARAIGDRMFKTHNERDFDLDWHKEKAEQLKERWMNVHSQIENRLRDLESIGKSLKYYKDTYLTLEEWIKTMEVAQLKTQENQPEDSKALAEFLSQQRILVSEIEQTQSKIDECQKYSEQYSTAVKDYELQIMTYRAMVDSQHKSPVKRRRMQNSSDAIIQEFMDLRTRYTALVTLMTQYVKFASDTLRRTEEEEKKKVSDRDEYVTWTKSLEVQKGSLEEENARLKAHMLELEGALFERQRLIERLEGELEMQRKTMDDLTLQKSKADYESKQCRLELEGAVKGKAAAEQELNHAKQLVQQSEAQRVSLEESLRVLRRKIEESTMARKKLEDHLRRKDSNVQDLEEHRRTLERELKVKEGAEAELMNQVRMMEIDLPQQMESRGSQNELRISISRESYQQVPIYTSLLNSERESVLIQRDQEAKKAEVLQHKVEELTMSKRRAETEIKTLKSELNSILVQKNMAEEKAQRFKDLLDDTNNRLKKLQMDVDSERSGNRQKSEELRQEITELKKSVYIFQEQVKSLQRDKSSLEQKVMFHKTEVDGLKEQLKINQSKLLQRSSQEQEVCRKIQCLEEELATKHAEGDQLRFKVNELTRSNVKLDNDIRNLMVTIETVQQDKTFAEQKLKTQKGEVDNLKELVLKAKEDINLKTKSEQEGLLKSRNLEVELDKKNQEVSQMRSKIEELKKLILERERSVKVLKTELDKAIIDISSKDQQINILKSQVDSAKSQMRIIEEDLLKKTQTLYELQIKLRDYNEEVQKTSELQQKNKSLNQTITNNEIDIRKLKSEVNSLNVEKKMVDKTVQDHKLKVNDLNAALKKTTDELHKETTEGQKLCLKVKELEGELLKCKQVMKGMSGDNDKIVTSLKNELGVLQKEKDMADRKLSNLKSDLDAVNASLKRTSETLQKETQDNRLSQSKIRELEGELQRNRLTLKEVSSSSDKFTSNFKQEITVLQKERNVAEDKSRSLVSEVTLLKQKLDQAQEEVKQKQKESATAQLRSQKLEEQLDNCKRMLDELKGKFELQKKGYERQLEIVQTEMEQKLLVKESSVKMECDKKLREHFYSTETAERESKYLRQDVEQLKLFNENTLKAKQELEQQLESLRLNNNQIDKERISANQELISAKTRIAEVESEKISLTANVSRNETLQTVISQENLKLKQSLAETEQKLTLKELEARSLNEQIASYIKEVKELQEKLLKLEVSITSDNRIKEMVVMNNQPFGEAAKTKTVFGRKEKADEEFEKSSLLTSRLFSQSETQNPIKSSLQTSNMVTDSVDKTSSDLSKTLTNKSSTWKISTYVETHGNGVSKDGSLTNNTGVNKAVQSPNPTEFLETFQSQAVRSSVQITQLITTNVVDSDTVLRMKSGQLSLEDNQSSLTRFIGKTPAIAGVYLESSKRKISFLVAAERGFIAKTYAIEFLEAQAATGSIIDHTMGKSYSVKEALERGIVGEELKEKLLDAEKAVTGYFHGGKMLSVFQAMEERIIDRHRGRKILEAQIATGGLIDPHSGLRLPPDVALQEGLIDKITLKGLYEPVSNPKGFHNPDTGQKAYYCELLKLCVYDTDGCVFLLPFGDRRLTNISLTSLHRISVINSANNMEISTYQAYVNKLIDKTTYLFLSQLETEWKETSVTESGGKVKQFLTDFKSGRQFSIEQALAQKIIIKSELEKYRAGVLCINEFADLLISRKVTSEDPHSPIAGLWDFTLKSRLSILKGLQQNLLDRITATRLLEAQACTGGICDPSTGEKLRVAEAVQKGFVDESLSRQLLQFEQAYYGITHQSSSKVLSVGQAIQQNLFPKDAGFRCLEYQCLTGGLVQPNTHTRVKLEDAVQCGLIDQSTLAQLKDEKSASKILTCPRTKRKISFKEALERGVYDGHTGLKLLEATKPYSVGAASSFHYFWMY